jgi:hypothetical protein
MPRERCVLCGGLDMLGMGVCASCFRSGDRPDAFVFFERPRSNAERDAVLEATVDLLGDDAPTRTIADVATGARSLVRVPASSRERVTEVLAARGIRARVVPERELYRALPSSFVLVVLGVAVAGIATGLVADSGIGATAIPFALLLTAGGTLSLRQTAVTSDRRQPALGSEATARVIESFTMLPAGTARSLLADVVRRGHAVQRALVLRRDPSGLGPMVDQLIIAACESARDLAAIDESLALFDHERRLDDADTRWLDSYADCEQTRDATVQRLLDAVTVLGQLDAQSMRESDDLGSPLAELIAEIAGEVDARAAAREEIRSLLEPRR